MKTPSKFESKRTGRAICDPSLVEIGNQWTREFENSAPDVKLRIRSQSLRYASPDIREQPRASDKTALDKPTCHFHCAPLAFAKQHTPLDERTPEFATNTYAPIV